MPSPVAEDKTRVGVRPFPGPPGWGDRDLLGLDRAGQDRATGGRVRATEKAHEASEAQVGAEREAAGLGIRLVSPLS